MENNNENIIKINKPLFFATLKDGIFVFVGFIIGCISFLFSDLDKTFKTINLKYNWVIFISIIVLISIIFFFKYLYSISKFYKSYEEQFITFETTKKKYEELILQFKDKQKEITNLERKLGEYDFILNNVISSIHAGAAGISDKEKQFLLNLHAILLIDKDYLLKTGGKM